MMSMMIMVQVMRARVGNPARKLVLLKLADCASDSGECFPSYQHIADHCEMSRRAVISHINALKKDGFLWIEKRKYGKENQSNIFHLTIKKGMEKSGENSAPPSEYFALGSEQSAPPPSEYSAPPSANSAPITSQLTSHSFYPVNETSERTHADACSTPQASFSDPPKRTSSKRETELRLLAEIGVTGQIAQDHLAIRKAKRLPLTKTAAQQMAKDAAACGLTLAQALEIAIGYGWASFRADWFLERQQGAKTKPNAHSGSINTVHKHTNGGFQEWD